MIIYRIRNVKQEKWDNIEKLIDAIWKYRTLKDGTIILIPTWPNGGTAVRHDKYYNLDLE